MSSSGNPTSKHVAIMRIVVSLILLVSGILIITAPHALISIPMNDGVQKVATGWIGAVIGYWLA